MKLEPVAVQLREVSILADDHLKPPHLMEPPRIDEQNRRLCHATSKRTGQPCNAPAMHGQTVCRAHGGASGQAKRAASLRLLELVDPAIARLAEEMEHAPSSSDRLRAANSILDRAGYGRASKVDPADARALLLERLLELRDEAQHKTAIGSELVVESNSVLEQEKP